MPSFQRFRIKPRLRVSELVQQLFQVFVIDDERSLVGLDRAQIEANSRFRAEVFERQRLTYLIASIALAITSNEKTHKATAEIARCFRAVASAELLRRWPNDQDSIDLEIEQAAQDLAKLVFTDPSNDRGLSYDWARDWLLRVGIVETNPATLFMFSTRWKNHFISAAKFISGVRVADLF